MKFYFKILFSKNKKWTKKNVQNQNFPNELFFIFFKKVVSKYIKRENLVLLKIEYYF